MGSYKNNLWSHDDGKFQYKRDKICLQFPSIQSLAYVDKEVDRKTETVDCLWSQFEFWTYLKNYNNFSLKLLKSAGRMIFLDILTFESAVGRDLNLKLFYLATILYISIT